jgi:hypothetical protein
MPSLELHTHVKHWQKSYFYCKAKIPSGEHPLPGYSVEPLVINSNMNSFASDTEREALQPLLKKISVLVKHGLRGTDLIKTWMGWRIQPNSIRKKLLCDYSGHLTDSLRYSEKSYPNTALNKAIKAFLAEKVETIKDNGLLPFSKNNPAPPVSTD